MAQDPFGPGTGPAGPAPAPRGPSTALSGHSTAPPGHSAAPSWGSADPSGPPPGPMAPSPTTPGPSTASAYPTGVAPTAATGGSRAIGSLATWLLILAIAVIVLRAIAQVIRLISIMTTPYAVLSEDTSPAQLGMSEAAGFIALVPSALALGALLALVIIAVITAIRAPGAPRVWSIVLAVAPFALWLVEVILGFVVGVIWGASLGDPATGVVSDDGGALRWFALATWAITALSTLALGAVLVIGALRVRRAASSLV